MNKQLTNEDINRIQALIDDCTELTENTDSELQVRLASEYWFLESCRSSDEQK
jgi:hypothetical protein